MRKSRHLSSLTRNNHHNKKIQHVFNKHGQPNFHILEECDIEELNKREQFYLDLLFELPECLNLAKYAEASARGMKHSNETRQKMSETRTGRKHSEETKRKIREVAKKRMTDEFRQKLREAHTGDKNHRSKPVEQYSKEGEFIKLWASGNLAATELGINGSDISRCASGRKGWKTAGGFIWKYKSEPSLLSSSLGT